MSWHKERTRGEKTNQFKKIVCICVCILRWRETTRSGWIDRQEQTAEDKETKQEQERRMGERGRRKQETGRETTILLCRAIPSEPIAQKW